MTDIIAINTVGLTHVPTLREAGPTRPPEAQMTTLPTTIHHIFNFGRSTVIGPILIISPAAVWCTVTSPKVALYDCPDATLTDVIKANLKDARPSTVFHIHSGAPGIKELRAACPVVAELVTSREGGFVRIHLKVTSNGKPDDFHGDEQEYHQTQECRYRLHTDDSSMEVQGEMVDFNFNLIQRETSTRLFRDALGSPTYGATDDIEDLTPPSWLIQCHHNGDLFWLRREDYEHPWGVHCRRSADLGRFTTWLERALRVVEGADRDTQDTSGRRLRKLERSVSDMAEQLSGLTVVMRRLVESMEAETDTNDDRARQVDELTLRTIQS